MYDSGDRRQQKNIPRKWSQLSYAGEKRVPRPEESGASFWPAYFLKRDASERFTDLNNQPISWDIRHPDTIDFEEEQLKKVKQTLKNLTQEQIVKAEFWNSGPPTKQFTPMIDRLIDTYGISASRAARILAAVQAGINDTLVVTWYYKFAWDIARPNQLDQNLATITCTPRQPSYPAGHATIAGCVEAILSYFFAPESDRLRELAEECADSRVFAGVHYPVDCSEGLRLGRHVGRIVVAALAEQHDRDGIRIDSPITENRHADLPPPPYVQAIPFPRSRKCGSKLDPREAPEAR